MTDLPPVPDGLADRLREAVRERLCKRPPSWTVAETARDAVNAVLADPAVAAALASPPAAPAGEPEPECSACTGDECADLTCPASKRPCGHHCNCVMIHDHCHWCGTEWGEEGVEIPSPAPAPSGETAQTSRSLESNSEETAERAKALLAEVWTQGHSAAVAVMSWRSSLPEHVRDADVERYARQLAGLLSSPARAGKTAGRLRAFVIAAGATDEREAYTTVYDGDMTTLTADLRALLSSPAQTPEPGRWSKIVAMEEPWDRIMAVLAADLPQIRDLHLRCIADRLVDALSSLLAASPAQTDGERREWRVVASLRIAPGREWPVPCETREQAVEFAAEFDLGDARVESRALGPWSPVPSPETETPESDPVGDDQHENDDRQHD